MLGSLREPPSRGPWLFSKGIVLVTSGCVSPNVKSYASMLFGGGEEAKELDAWCSIQGPLTMMI